MNSERKVLESVRDGTLSVEEAIPLLDKLSVEDLGHTQLDHQRVRRTGFPEVVYCAGKTTAQCVEIIQRLAKQNYGNILGTRASHEVYEALVTVGVNDVQYDSTSQIVYIRRGPQKSIGSVAVVAAGTSDMPVAEEAALTAELMGSTVTRVYDVGVAGLHRLLRQLDVIRSARVIIAIAGMEGALVSVLAGLVETPVIGVPTSVGYGAQLRGVVPLLSMLSTCVPGIAVVNIDNGFGAGYMASLINHGPETRIPTSGGE